MDSETNLNILDLPSIFQSLSDNRRDGSLRITCDEGLMICNFVQGSIMLVETHRGTSGVIEALRRFYKVAPQTLDELIQRSNNEQRPLGDIALEMELCSEEDLTQLLSSYIMEEICDVFAWKNVQFEFAKENLCQPIFSPEKAHLNAYLPPSAMMMEAARRLDESERIKEILPSKLDIPILQIHPEKLTNENERDLSAWINGYQDIEELQEMADLSRFSILVTLKEMAKNKTIRLLNAEELKNVLKKASAQEDWLKGIRLYIRIEQMEGKTPESCQWLAQAFEKAQDVNSALHKYYELAEILLAKKDLSRYHDTLKRICTLDPNDLSTRERLIFSLLENARYEDAIESTKVLVNSYKKEERYPIAMELLSKVLEYIPENQDILKLLGEICVKNGDEIQALYTYENLAQVQLDQKRYDDAVETYRRMLKIDNENIDAHFKLANTLREKDDNDSAVKQFKALAELLSSTGTLANSINWNFLINVYENIVSIESKNYTAREWLADAYIRNNQKEKALNHLRAIIEILDLREEDAYMLIATLKKIIELEPNELKNRLSLAEVYLLIDDKESAIEEWKSIGLMAIVQDKFDLALEVFQKILKRTPFHLDAHQGIAKVYFQQKKLAECIRKYLDLGYLMKASSNYPEAINYFQKVYSLNSQEKRCIFELGEIQTRIGDTIKAIEYYLQFARESFAIKNYGEVRLACDRVLSLQPNHQLAASMLSKIQQITQN